MKDADGRVRIAGFYDDVVPLGEAEKRALAALPNMEKELREELGLGSIEVAGRDINESINLPALNIQGFSSGGVGNEARNVIPSTATASIGIRLVKGMDPAKTVSQLTEHVRRQGYFVTQAPPSDAERLRHPRVAMVKAKGDYVKAVRTPLDAPFAKRVIAAVTTARGPLLLQPTSGGTLPLDAIDDVLGAPIVTLPIANHDNNQHTHNENIRLQNLWDGIETIAALMLMR
jgi:acetylornithine deacetylase/succinyl-diaminopimelate desuccinylase-like protein